jgi:cytidylate kinase
MGSALALERCLAFIRSQLQPARGPDSEWPNPLPAVTISRQAGCGAHAIAEALADYLIRKAPTDTGPWAVFDQNLVARVLEEHDLPQRLARFMPEDTMSEIRDTIDDLFGLHPPSEILARQTAETILHLARLGKVILIGRGANVITRKLAHVFHVRLVGSLEQRTARIQQVQGLHRSAALRLVRKTDRARAHYFKKYLHEDIEDPLLYHLVMNTDLCPADLAARLIGDVVLARSPGRVRPSKVDDLPI